MRLLDAFLDVIWGYLVKLFCGITGKSSLFFAKLLFWVSFFTVAALDLAVGYVYEKLVLTTFSLIIFLPIMWLLIWSRQLKNLREIEKGSDTPTIKTLQALIDARFWCRVSAVFGILLTVTRLDFDFGFTLLLFSLSCYASICFYPPEPSLFRRILRKFKQLSAHRPRLYPAPNPA